MPIAGLGLGDLVGVVDGDVVFAAAVDIKKGAQVFGRHGRALDMPAREAHAPRAVPFHLALLVSGGLNFHRAKSVGLRFSPISIRAPACRPSISRRPRIAVIGQFGGIEVDAVGGAVGEALVFDAADEIDLFGDVIGGAAPDGRLQDVQDA